MAERDVVRVLHADHRSNRVRFLNLGRRCMADAEVPDEALLLKLSKCVELLGNRSLFRPIVPSHRRMLTTSNTSSPRLRRL